MAVNAQPRDDITTGLIRDLVSHEDIVAIWEGGAAATGRLDDFSDLDLCLLIRPGAADSVLARIDQTLGKSVARSWRKSTPAPWWAAEKLYLLADAPQFFFIDAVLFEDNDDRAYLEFMEVERHGRAVVHHDPQKLLSERSVCRSDLRTRLQAKLDDIRGAFPFFVLLVDKELARGNDLTALHSYQRGVLQLFVETVNIAERTPRHDFALRYAESELTEESKAILRELAFVPGADALAHKLRSLEDHFHRMLEKASLAVAALAADAD